MKLVLFDIDGTLLYSQGNGKLALTQATEKVFGKAINSNIAMAGKTDTQIIHEMIPHTFSREEIEERMSELFLHYLYYLKEYYTIERGVGVYAGVRELLDHLSTQDNVVLALLTGNIFYGAQIKLGVFSLNDYFKFGAYGDDGFYRHELPDIALDRAIRQTNIHFSGKDIVIIGDTVNDIECGRHLGVKSIVVCTNKSTEQALKKAQPDYFLDSFKNTQEVIDAIFCNDNVSS